MTHEEFFHWMNSRYGRLFGDAVFGGKDRAEADARRWHLVHTVEEHKLERLAA